MLPIIQMGPARRKKRTSRRKSVETVFSVVVVTECLQQCYTELHALQAMTNLRVILTTSNTKTCEGSL